ncbi:MAG: hypothetical protein HRU33_09580 [Rhodobacteraceae bacterium]|nr:hypothetical protein [Paracoccaceae bacterium]
MLEQNWFTEDDLFDTDGLHILDAGEEIDETTKGQARESASADGKDLLTLDITGPLGNTMDKAKAVLNYRYKAVNIGGDMVFIRVPDFSIDNESRMEIWKELPLRRFHDDRKVQVKKTKTDKNGKETVEWEWVNPVVEFAATAKRHGRVVFAPPPARTPSTSLNLFQGFQLEPVKGDCEDLEAFIKDIICDGDADVFKWVWHWMAHLLQRPGEKPGTAIVAHGAGGAGKGTFGEILRALVHPYSMHAGDADQILGKHVGPTLANSLICSSEESFFAGDKRQSDKLKGKITEPMQNVEPKHVQAFEMPSFTRYYIEGNGAQLVNIENNGSERRFCVTEVSDARCGDLEYFKDLRQQIDGPELAALAYELRQYNPASVGMEWGDVRRAPDTIARKRMGYQSRPKAERALLKAIEEGKITFGPIGRELEYELADDEVTKISSQHCRDFLKPYANQHAADSDNVIKLAERIFGKDHGFVKSKTVIDVAINNHGIVDMAAKNVAYFEFPAGNWLREKMRGLGYLWAPR